MNTAHRVIFGDSRQMSRIGDASVQLVVTSPPYWQLKDYGANGQIGFNDSYEGYINNLNLVWAECFRILSPGCRLCVNIGDQFARAVYYGRYKVIPIREEIIKFCEIAGFDYMGAVIWQKVTTTNTTGGATIMGSFPFPRNGILKIDYEFILLFKKQGKTPPPTTQAKQQARLTTDEWNEYFAGHWNFAGARQDEHLAVFPEELPKRLIRMFTFPGETVVDPFLGSGTTSLAALNNGRHSIGYEINREFRAIIERKLGCDQASLFHTAAVSFEDAGQVSADFPAAIASLPYRFVDPHRLDKKTDPATMSFGSRVHRDSPDREEYHRVREVVSGNEIVLSNGLAVRLLGVKARPGREESAREFLVERTAGQRVFLKFDEQKHDRRQVLLAYVYLENKTFLNAHLLKAGIGEPDGEFPFRFSNRFAAILKDPHAA